MYAQGLQCEKRKKIYINRIKNKLKSKKKKSCHDIMRQGPSEGVIEFIFCCRLLQGVQSIYPGRLSQRKPFFSFSSGHHLEKVWGVCIYFSIEQKRRSYSIFMELQTCTATVKPQCGDFQKRQAELLFYIAIKLKGICPTDTIPTFWLL